MSLDTGLLSYQMCFFWFVGEFFLGGLTRLPALIEWAHLGDCGSESEIWFLGQKLDLPVFFFRIIYRHWDIATVFQWKNPAFSPPTNCTWQGEREEMVNNPTFEDMACRGRSSTWWFLLVIFLGWFSDLQIGDQVGSRIESPGRCVCRCFFFPTKSWDPPIQCSLWFYPGVDFVLPKSEGAYCIDTYTINAIQTKGDTQMLGGRSSSQVRLIQGLPSKLRPESRMNWEWFDLSI